MGCRLRRECGPVLEVDEVEGVGDDSERDAAKSGSAWANWPVSTTLNCSNKAVVMRLSSLVICRRATTGDAHTERF
jgi:hypothetical protein